MWLDHENFFESIAFVNSSVIHLAEFLLIFREMIAEARLLRGSDAFLNGIVPDETRERAVTAMASVDPPALAEEAFWFWQVTAG